MNHRHADFQPASVCSETNTSIENVVKPAVLNQTLSGDLSNRETAINTAALWLCRNRDEISGPVIPAVMRKFDLTRREAIEALKRGHELRHGGGNV